MRQAAPLFVRLRPVSRASFAPADCVTRRRVRESARGRSCNMLALDSSPFPFRELALMLLAGSSLSRRWFSSFGSWNIMRSVCVRALA